METGVKPETDAVVDIFDPADTQVYSYEITKKSFECRCFRIADPYAYGCCQGTLVSLPFHSR